VVGKTLTDEEFDQYLKDVQNIDRKYKIIYEKAKKNLTGERYFLPFEEHKALVVKIHRNYERAIDNIRKSKYGLGKRALYKMSLEKIGEYFKKISAEDKNKHWCRIAAEVPWENK
jgi:hypothetical protein